VKILFLALEPVAGWGGSEELWADTAQSALEHGHQVWVTPRVDPHGTSTKLTELRRLGATIVPRRCWTAPSGALQAEVLPPGLLAIARNADAVFISVGGSLRDLLDEDIVALIEAIETPVVATIQLTRENDPLPDDLRVRARLVLSRLGALIVPAHRSKKVIERAVATQLRDCAVIPSPIRSDLPGPIPWPAAQIPSFACIARLSPAQKGQDLLLEVLSEPQWKTRRWNLNLVGRGLGDTYLKELAAHYGVTERVTLTGFQSDMAQVWSQNHILVMPSREESMPIAIMEAMFCARPCVVTDVGDNARLLKDGVNGYVAAADRPRLLADALERAWAGRRSWRSMGLQAHEAFVDQRDPKPGRTALSLLESVARRRPRAGVATG